MAHVPDPPSALAKGLQPIYREAAAIADESPASACALLRLLIQTVVKNQGLRGRHIVRDVGTLVEGGAPVSLLRALDVINMSDDEAKRPAEINLANGHSEAQNLFMFVNLLVDHGLGD